MSRGQALRCDMSHRDAVAARCLFRRQLTNSTDGVLIDEDATKGGLPTMGDRVVSGRCCGAGSSGSWAVVPGGRESRGVEPRDAFSRRSPNCRRLPKG